MTNRGIHHVSAISGPASRNISFYTRTLGLRLVKKTVNYEDPTGYHFYFGSDDAVPGSLITFFPWAHAAAGRLGPGEAQETSFRVPEEALGFWMHRFLALGVDHDRIETRFGRRVLPFRDPDGTRLALVGIAGAALEPATGRAGIEAEQAIRGLHGATLLVERGEATGRVLEALGFSRDTAEGETVRYVADAETGGVIDVRAAGGFPRGRPGAGTVHHIAFRAGDERDAQAMIERLREVFDVKPTEIKDRTYFRSIYFREPGGVLFEIATDGPGLTIDEPAGLLGVSLRLPPFLEPHRAVIEAGLPDIS